MGIKEDYKEAVKQKISALFREILTLRGILNQAASSSGLRHIKDEQSLSSCLGYACKVCDFENSLREYQVNFEKI